MVYGLNVKPEAGYHIGVDLLDGDLDKVKAVDQTPDGGPNWTTKTSGRQVDGTLFPRHVKWLDSDNAVPDFDAARALTVSGRAKAVIESIEPGVHQFFPVEFVTPKGVHLENRYWLVICNRIDSIEREHTTMVLRKGWSWRPARDLARRGEPIPPHIDPKAPSKMVFDLKAIGDRHMWHDKHLDGGSVIVSDFAAGRLEQEGLTGIDLSKAEAV